MVRGVFFAIVVISSCGCNLTPSDYAEGVGATGQALKEGAITALENPSITGIIQAFAIAGLGIWKGWSTVAKRRKYAQMESQKDTLESRVQELEAKIAEQAKA